MIFRAISALIATRASFTLTMMLPLMAATTVAVPPATKPSSSRAAYLADQILRTHVGQCQRHHTDPSNLFS